MPKETVETFLVHTDGKIWFHTGDIGVKEEDGVLRIVVNVIITQYNMTLIALCNKHDTMAVACGAVFSVTLTEWHPMVH